jgi:hypothetical protein
MYWNITSQNRPQGSIKDQLLYYINYSLNEFKAELSSSIDAWVAKYGRPEGTQGLT